MLATKRLPLTDQQGRLIELGALLGRGGEGSVYRLSSDASLVAKIYHQPLTPDRSAKIAAMAGLSSASLERICAWPRGLIMEGRRPRGLLMPLITNRKELHVLHGPKSRKAEFPDAGFDFLVHVALNVARAFVRLHEASVIVGDVNDRGMMVGADGLVRLIDCDSFQIAAQGRTFRCEVGVPEYTPPELQGVSLNGITRTANHDAFGLAVLIFRLLFMGRHPFAGRFHGGHKEIHEAIAEGRFAYAADKACTRMDPPPNMLTIEQGVGQAIAAHFERAFSAPAGARPSAEEWVSALAALRSDLKKCQFNTAHAYVKSLASCPWCELEQRCGVDLFHFVPADADAVLTIDLDAIWQALGALKVPDVPQPVPDHLVSFRQRQHFELKTLHDEAAKLKDEALRARQVAKQFTRDVTRKEQAAAAMVFELTRGDAEVLALERRLACLKGPEKPRLGTRLLPLIALGVSVYAAQIHSREWMVLAVLPLAAMFATDWLVAGVRKWAAARLARRIERRRIAVLASDAEAQDRLNALHAEAAAAKAEAQRAHETASNMEQTAAEAEARYATAREPEVRAADHCLQVAQNRADNSRDALATLMAEAATLRAELQARREKVNGSRLLLINLDRAREADLRQLREADRTAQLERFLDQHFITNAKIDGITPALLAALVSFGIQTAADINAKDVGNVPGFGKMRTRRMVDWRNRIARSFRYVPAQAIDPVQRRAIDSKYAAGRARVARDLVTARTEIERRIADLANRIAPAKDAADASVRALVQARADRRALDFS